MKKTIDTNNLFELTVPFYLFNVILVSFESFEPVEFVILIYITMVLSSWLIGILATLSSSSGLSLFKIL